MPCDDPIVASGYFPLPELEKLSSWHGIQNDGLGRTCGPDDGYRGIVRDLFPARPPEPTLAERQDRCEQMGLIFCSCVKVDGQVAVYDPKCPVCNRFLRIKGNGRIL